MATVKSNVKKSEKDRISVAMCCNMTGAEKMKLVVIGKSKQPRAICKANTKQMKFLYFNNQTAWQNRSTFAEWLWHFDAKMHGRRVLLLLDNASCHYGAANCYNFKLAFLPPNMTAHLQPLDAEIIRAFKARYRKKFVRLLLDAIHTRIDRKLNILEAVRFAISRLKGVPEQVIRNCWSKCAIVEVVTTADLTQLRDYNKRIDGSVEDELTKLMGGLTCRVSVVDYIGADGDEPIESDSDVIEYEAIENDNDGDSADEVTIGPSEALDCCLLLSSFLSLQHESEELTKKLASITKHARQQ